MPVLLVLGAAAKQDCGSQWKSDISLEDFHLSKMKVTVLSHGVIELLTSDICDISKTSIPRQTDSMRAGMVP